MDNQAYLRPDFFHNYDQSPSERVSKKLRGKVSLQTIYLLLKCTESVKLPRLTFNFIASPTVLRFGSDTFCDIVINDFAMSEAFVTPTNWITSCEELHIPCVMTYHENVQNIQELTEFYYNALKSIIENDYRLSFHVAQLTRLLCSLCHQQNNVKLIVDLITFNIDFSLTPSPALSVIPTALYKSLTEATSNDLTADFQMGYLALNQSHKTIFVLRSDPKLCTFPVNGAWVAGPTAVNDNFIWTACIIFMKNPVLKNRILSETNTFHLIHIPSDDCVPRFYECSVKNINDCNAEFSLQEAVVNLNSVSKSMTEYASFEFKYSSPLKNQAFHSAVKKIDLYLNERHKTLSSSNEENFAHTQKNNKDFQALPLMSRNNENISESIPRTSPNPHQATIKMPVPSVPDPSLIIDSKYKEGNPLTDGMYLQKSDPQNYLGETSYERYLDQNLCSTPYTPKTNFKHHENKIVCEHFADINSNSFKYAPYQTPCTNISKNLTAGKTDVLQSEISSTQHQDLNLKSIQDHVKNILEKHNYCSEQADNFKLKYQDVNDESFNNNFPCINIENGEMLQNIDINCLNAMENKPKKSSFDDKNHGNGKKCLPHYGVDSASCEKLDDADAWRLRHLYHSQPNTPGEANWYKRQQHQQTFTPNLDDVSLSDINSVHISEMSPSVRSSFNIDMPDYQSTIFSPNNPDFEKTQFLLHKENESKECTPYIIQNAVETVHNILKNQNYVDMSEKLPEDDSSECEKFVGNTQTGRPPDLCASSFDSFTLPTLKYESRYFRDDNIEKSFSTDSSLQFNKMAMKYLPDDSLSKAVQSASNEQLSPAKGGLLRKALINNQFGVNEVSEASNKTLYGLPCLSFASDTYLKKYGLIPKEAVSKPAQTNSAVLRKDSRYILKVDDETEESSDEDFEPILNIKALQLQRKLL